MSAVVARLRGLPPALLGLLALALVPAVLVPAWGPLTRQAERTAAVLRSSDPRALALALSMAAFAVVCTGLAWVVAARSLGSRETFRAGLTRYTVACWAPPKLGNPCRIVLLARTLPGPRSVWAMTGVCGGISLLRVLPLAMLIVVAAARGWLSLWPAIALVLVAVSVLSAAPLLYRRLRGARLQRLLSGFALLARSRPTAAICLSWLSLATLGKLMAAMATASALGFPDPLGEALLLIPALAFGRTLPFLGFAAGAVAVSAGADTGVGHAVSLVFAVSAVEGAAAISCGIVAASRLLRTEHLRNWRTALRTLVTARKAGRGSGAGQVETERAARPSMSVRAE
jgi:hypothetical protein